MAEGTELQRRSSWTCDSLTISYASPRGTNRCRRCKCFMAGGELRFGMIFKSNSQHMLYQWYHMSCYLPPDTLTCSSELEGIQDISPSDVEIISRWIQTGMAPPAVGSLSGPKYDDVTAVSRLVWKGDVMRDAAARVRAAGADDVLTQLKGSAHLLCGSRASGPFHTSTEKNVQAAYPGNTAGQAQGLVDPSVL